MLPNKLLSWRSRKVNLGNDEKLRLLRVPVRPTLVKFNRVTLPLASHPTPSQLWHGLMVLMVLVFVSNVHDERKDWLLLCRLSFHPISASASCRMDSTPLKLKKKMTMMMMIIVHDCRVTGGDEGVFGFMVFLLFVNMN